MFYVFLLRHAQHAQYTALTQPCITTPVVCMRALRPDHFCLCEHFQNVQSSEADKQEHTAVLLKSSAFKRLLSQCATVLQNSTGVLHSTGSLLLGCAQCRAQS